MKKTKTKSPKLTVTYYTGSKRKQKATEKQLREFWRGLSWTTANSRTFVITA